MWMGGVVPLGYDVIDRKLVINDTEAETVRTLFRLYLKRANVRLVKLDADRRGLRLNLEIRPTVDGPAESRSREATYTSC